MILPQLVLALAWTFGANGFLIERQLAGVEALPAAALIEVADHARIVFHDRQDWAMAFFLPAASELETASGAARPDPRLFLYAPYYLASGGLVAASRMPVDVAEYYYHALLAAALELERASGSRYFAWTRQRAEELMADVPAAQRHQAYLQAAADFGAHLLSIRNELARLAERQAGAGRAANRRDVCRHLDRPASLFGLWHRSLEQGAYHGSYQRPAAGGRPLQSRRPLARSDKTRFLAEVLGVDWSGDPANDFADLCRGRN